MSDTIRFSITSPYYDHLKVMVVDKITGETHECELTKSAPVACEVKRNAEGNGEVELHPQIGQTVERVVQDGETVFI